MKNKNFINAFSEIYPQKNKRDEILKNIFEVNKKKVLTNKMYFKVALSFAAIFILIISFPKKEVLIEPSLSRSNILTLEESHYFIYNNYTYMKSDSSFSINKESSNEITRSQNPKEELTPFVNNSLSEKDFLGEYLFTIEDSSNSLFGARIYKSIKDEKKLIVLFNNIYEEYEITVKE